MKKLIIIIFLLILVNKPTEIFAYSDGSYKALSSFVAGFPKMAQGGQGGLCIYGYDQVAVGIKEKYQNTAIFKSEEDLKVAVAKNQCKIIYISKNRDFPMTGAIKIANDARIISIGIDDYFVDKGGMISVQMGRRSFELTINHKNIKEFKTKFDPLVQGLVIN